MLLSVVVPHLNQENYLKRCLESLAAQQRVEAELEIIVVDNGSRKMPKEVCQGWPNVRLLSEIEPGPGPARNRGISDAKGDLLAFIDADCTAHPDWLASIETAFHDSATQIIGGDVQVSYADPTNPTFLEPYEAIYSYRNNEHIAEGFSGTGNLATRPEVMADVGPFAGISMAEDRDWGLRAGAKGYPIRYVPEMIVYHPARDTFAALAQKWDRHVAHDYHDFLEKPLGRLKWLARAVAVAGSPVFEFKRLATSPRVNGFNERWLAFLCLVRIRVHRARRMVSVAVQSTNDAHSGAWNRD
ncbi:glycosyltransferase involved in cell wall biosynthesis [Labrenzia sp. EL_208]|nr:glycosyltransferase involved in cell wall biosynthesis [Labrenzia sp. EL_132]MBG6230824.1 glycosyltransferase involved in cell wall biosynthesis [Labrenzia sp. EL_208]